jgi:cytochrome c556
MKNVVMAILAAGLLSSAIGPSFAADATDKTVKQRRAYFQVVLSNAGPLFGMLKGKMAYDAAKATTFANNLKLISQVKNGHLFPKGSGNDNPALKGQTRALPAIWAAGSDIGKKFAAWREAIAKLASVAGNGKDAMSAQMKLVGATCAACHKSYRAKDF